MHAVESPTWSALGRVVAYAETGQSGVAEFAPFWSACANRSQKLLDNGQPGSYSGPEVGFEEITLELLQVRFWIASG
jgi:hypothetical protein